MGSRRHNRIGDRICRLPSYNGADGNIHRVRLDDSLLTIEEDLTYEIPWATGQIGWDITVRNGQLYVRHPPTGSVNLPGSSGC